MKEIEASIKEEERKREKGKRKLKRKRERERERERERKKEKERKRNAQTNEFPLHQEKKKLNWEHVIKSFSITFAVKF